MTTAFRRFSTCGAVLSIALFASAAVAQTAPPTALQKQLDRIDLGAGVVGELNPTNSGLNYVPQAINQRPSNTAGALIELRYIKSPWFGIQLNYGQARYTEDYTITNTTGTPKGQLPYVLGVQSKVTEYSLGYVAHFPRLLGVEPFAGGGLGGMEFKPTAGGGQGLPPQARTGIYYAVGVEQTVFSDHFGLRLQFRQLFFGAPDFNQNYLAIGSRSVTTEPGVGFFLRF